MNRADQRTLGAIFRKGSKTYFNSSVFFPRQVRLDVFALYGFVRVADNFVDSVPQDKAGFLAFRRAYEKHRTGKEASDSVISLFQEIFVKRKFEKKWVDAFLDSMQMDLKKERYADIRETLRYIYGSAEVIGLMMSRIMGLPKQAEHFACFLGRAMQYINFIRDIDEDLGLGRNYFPQTEMRKFGLHGLSHTEAQNRPEAFRAFIREQLRKYREWQSVAEQGFRFIPRRFLIPVKTASDMYNWTGKEIEADPFIVFRKKVKPSRLLIFRTLIKNMLTIKG